MIKRFFILCSGADLNLIKECSNGEQNKYAGIGATVFFTAIMAFIASSYALFTVFDNIYTSLFFGVIWGLLIFNLDRYIVSTLRKNGTFSKQLTQVIPRLALAIIIAVVISKPLELKIFEKEINQVLLTQKNKMTLDNKNQISERFTPEKEKLQSHINILKAEIIKKEKETNQLYETYINEAEGTLGTKLKGKGPVYKEKREKHDASLAELSKLKDNNSKKISQKENQIAILIQKQKDTEITSQPIISNFDGLMARINALDQLPWLPSFFIFLLFLTIETAPILTKLISNKSEYDFKLENNEAIIKTWVMQQEDLRKKIMMNDIDLNDEIYNNKKIKEEMLIYKQQMVNDLIKSQTTLFLQNQQKHS